MGPTTHALTRPPALPRELRRALNRLAGQRARPELTTVWRRHQMALQAAAVDMLLAGRTPEAVLRELTEETCCK